jgi:hypothetical protein
VWRRWKPPPNCRRSWPRPRPNSRRCGVCEGGASGDGGGRSASTAARRRWSPPADGHHGPQFDWSSCGRPGASAGRPSSSLASTDSMARSAGCDDRCMAKRGGFAYNSGAGRDACNAHPAL